jgi:RNA polymerase sigma-70 factor, ECF subfamily
MDRESLLRLIARMEIDSRFGGKFSASDAVQQTLFAAWQAWDECHATNDAERLAWLRRILANQLAQMARSFGTQKRALQREISLEQSLAESSMQIGRLLPADVATPSQCAVVRERELKVAGLLERLPADYREVIVLRSLEERSYEEVAQRMGRSPGAVRILWVRALARLRNEADLLRGIA